MDPPTPPTLEDGFEYLSEPNENLICPICRNPFVDPVMCESTDHVFCRVCLIRSLEISSTCPIDRRPLSLSLVIPAPKIIIKLVDELLVSCPFKSKLDCGFVCQRDLMSAHVRSHQSTYYRPLSMSPRRASGTSTQDCVLDQHLTSRPSSPLRFEWLSGRATLVEDPPSQTPKPSEPHKQSAFMVTTTISCSTSTTKHPEDTSQPLAHCPFEQFGCQFIGTSQTIKHEHLSTVPFPNHLVASPDCTRCPFLFVQDILKSFQNLESRNNELKRQLSQSLVKQDELTSVIQSLKASFRQLWLSRQPTITDQPFTTSSAQASPLVKPPLTPPICCTSTSDSCTSPRRSSDGSLPMYSSSMNYDTSNGNRLKHFNHSVPSRQLQHFSSPPNSSTSSTFMRNIRVSTFVQKGEVITPTTQIHTTTMPTNASTTSVGFDQPPCNSLTINPSPSRPESSVYDHLAVNSWLINPNLTQVIQTIHKHLDNHIGSKQRDDNLTTDHPTKMLDTLKEIKKLIVNLIDRESEDSEPKQLQQQELEQESSDFPSPSSSNSSSHTNVNRLTNHLNTPTDRRNSPHLKL